MSPSHFTLSKFEFTNLTNFEPENYLQQANVLEIARRLTVGRNKYFTQVKQSIVINEIIVNNVQFAS